MYKYMYNTCVHNIYTYIHAYIHLRVYRVAVKYNTDAVHFARNHGKTT
jgi:hypothetical protein